MAHSANIAGRHVLARLRAFHSWHSVPTMADPDPTLRIHIYTERPVLARHVGLILERCQAAFGQYSRERGPTGSLRIHNVQSGSLLLDLVSVIDSISTLHDHREILAGFVAQLGDTLQIMAGMRKGRVTTSDRRLIEALSAPVANDNAQQVCIQVIGDNNTVIVIDREQIEKIGSNRAMPVADNIVEQLVRPLIQRPSRALEEKELAALPDFQFPRSPDGVRNRTFKPAVGVLVWLEDRWYVRLDGQNPIMIPMLGSETMIERLQKQRTYQVNGRIVIDDGMVTAFEVKRSSS